MIQQDYILRLIQQFIAVLAKIILSKNLNNPEEMRHEIQSGYRLMGLSPEILAAFGYPGILVFLRPGGELQLEKCLFLAELMKLQGDLEHETNTGTCSAFYITSLGLFSEVLKADPSLYSDEFISSIEHLLDNLDTENLPAEIVSNLDNYFLIREQGLPVAGSDSLYARMMRMTEQAAKQKS